MRSTTRKVRKSSSSIAELGQNNRLYQELAGTLIAEIDRNVYKVGDRLPAEREIAIQYKVSRPTVREAMIAMEVLGLVEVKTGSGAYVKRKRGARAAPGFNVSAFELTEARLLFEGEAAALAATMITDEELAELDRLVRQIDRENRDDAGNDQADHDFHVLIARATRNVAIVNTVESLWQIRTSSPECALLLQRARQANVKPVVAEHAAIVKALRSRTPEKARAAMRAHLTAVMDHLLFTTEENAVAAARRSIEQTKARFKNART